MCSTPKKLTLVFGALGVLAGCEVKKEPAPESVSHAPIVIDEAMAQRQWPMSVAQYQNGSTPAYQTGAVITHRSDAPEWTNTITETPMFVANSLLTPIVFCFSPPWQRVIYPRGGVEPSYTAQPPLQPLPIKTPIGNAASSGTP